MNDGKWAPGTGFIIFLLLIIAAKVHVFDGLFAGLTNPTPGAVALVTVVLAIAIGLFAIMVVWLMLARIFRGELPFGLFTTASHDLLHQGRADRLRRLGRDDAVCRRIHLRIDAEEFEPCCILQPVQPQTMKHLLLGAIGSRSALAC